MKIQSSQIEFNSTHYFNSESFVERSLKKSHLNSQSFKNQESVQWHYSGELKSSVNIQHSQSLSQSKSNSLSTTKIDTQSFFKQTASALSKENTLLRDGMFNNPRTFSQVNMMMNQSRSLLIEQNSTLGSNQTNIHLSVEHFYQEIEHNQVNSRGVIQLESGEQIEFHLQLNMDRQYQTNQQSEYHGQRIWLDPLVMNFEGGAVEFSNSVFEFDLNSDGVNDQLKQTNKGTGFLVFDQNQNGIIDNGQEMFGPQSGSGFQDLAQYDEDQNGWIDANDSIFQKLQIQHFDEQGQVLIDDLSKLEIGAIYLDSIQSDFTLTDENNHAYGKIKQSSIGLNEQGNVLMIQEMDFNLYQSSTFILNTPEINGISLDVPTLPEDITANAIQMNIEDIQIVTSPLNNWALTGVPLTGATLQLNSTSFEVSSTQLNSQRRSQVFANPQLSLPPQTTQTNNENQKPKKEFTFRNRENETSIDYSSFKMKQKSLYEFEHKLDSNRFFKDEFSKFNEENKFDDNDRLLKMIENLKKDYHEYQQAKEKIKKYEL